MKSRKWIGTVLITLVVVAILSAGGYALYRLGYDRGSLAASGGQGFMFHHFEAMPFAGGMHAFPGRGFADPGDQITPRPFRDRLGNYGQFATPQCYSHGFAPMLGGGRLPYMGYFTPFVFILKLLFIGLIIWLIYKFVTLFTGGRQWQLSFNAMDKGTVEEEAKPKGRAKRT